MCIVPQASAISAHVYLGHCIKHIMLISKLLTDNRRCAADVAHERMAVRERATSVAKMYMGRAEKLQQDWQQHHADSNAGAAKPDTAQAELGVKKEGCFSVAAAVSS